MSLNKNKVVVVEAHLTIATSLGLGQCKRDDEVLKTESFGSSQPEINNLCMPQFLCL